ncbi:MAG TPA: SRPBCC domain-containing protein [Thermomicrobiales bacterium]|nr:SRPBCC domain-containing protein [Thermomicrobiales bacterium]
MTTPDQPQRIAHRMERIYDVAATPEEVWEVIATAAGISSWMVPTRLDPRIGGEISFDLGDSTLDGIVTDYTPHRRIAYEEPWPIAPAPEAIDPGMAQWFAAIGISLDEVYAGLPLVSPIATEFTVEAASGGTSVLRIVTSAYGPGANWENEFFAQMAESLIPMLDNIASRLPVTVR